MGPALYGSMHPAWLDQWMGRNHISTDFSPAYMYFQAL